MHTFEKITENSIPKKKKIFLIRRHFSDVFSSTEHEYSGPINQKSKHFRKKRQISTNIDKYRQISRFF